MHYFTPTPLAVGSFMGKHFMNCGENLYFFMPSPTGGGGQGENVKVTRPKHQLLKSISGMELF